MPPKPKLTPDIEGLAEQLGATVKEGVVSASRDKFYVTVNKKKVPIPIGEINLAADVKKMAGKTVPVILSGSALVAIGYPPYPWCFILCYYPPDIFRRRIPWDIRTQLLKQYAAEKIINEKTYKELNKAFAAQRPR